MLYRIKNRLLEFYLDIVSSIAFYPSIIASGMLFLALGLLSWEDTNVTNFLNEHAAFLVINNAETARTILGTLIGGIISLTVFSFSMVMVLLNQASTNFSPRLLPGLISDKRNQVVLGLYIGTILYNIIVLISILPDGNEYTLNGFSVLIGIVLGIGCLGMFVFFIHTISTGIQINVILDKIYIETKKRLLDQIDQERDVDESLDIDDNWIMLTSDKTGYFQGVNLDNLLSFVAEHKLNVQIIPYKGQYLLPNMPLIKYSKKLEESQKNQLSQFILYSNKNTTSDNYVMGIRQITEVGIKAMSPGINDPGTAVMTIDFLTELLALRMRIDDHEIYIVPEGKFKIELKTVNFDELIFQCLAAYRQYCKHDLILMEKLILMIRYLLKQACKHEKYYDDLREQLSIIEDDIKSNIQNKVDINKLVGLIKSCDNN